MEDFFDSFFKSGSFMPQGHCYFWESGILWTHVISDGLIAVSYYAIPICLAIIYKKRADIELRWILALFAIFIISCGTTHIMSLITVWNPLYWLEGAVKAMTALVSVGTAVVLLAKTPKILVIPGKQDWEKVNEELRKQIQQMKEREEEFRQSKEALHESEERYNALMQVFDSVVIHEEEKILFANSSASQLVGMERPEDLVGMSIYNFIPSDYEKIVCERIINVKEGKKISLSEQKIKRIDGQEVEIEIIGAPYLHNGKYAIQTVIRDITERKRNEKRLKESEARFRALFESNLIGIIFCDFNRTITDANDRFLEMTGYSREDVLNKRLNLAAMTPKEYGKSDQKILGSIKISGITPPFEKEYIRKDGTHIPLLVGASKMEGQDEIVAFVLDISKQKKAQQKIALSEERFRLVASATNDVIWDWDLSSNKIWWSEGMKNTFGHTMKEVDGYKGWARLVHPEDKERVTNSLQRTIDSREEQWSEEYRLIKEDGSYAYVLDRGYVLHDKAGKPFRMLGSIMDLTDLKKAQVELEKRAQELERNQESLRLSESKFRQIFESDMIGIMFCDFYGNVLDANDRFLTIVGYKKEDLADGKIKWTDMIPPEYKANDKALIRELVDNRIFKALEKELFRNDGSRVPVLMGGALLHGYNDMGVAFILDITERKKAEDKLTRTLDELKKRNHELDNYVYKVSHDLRAPLASVLGLINLLKLENDHDAIEKYIQLIDNRVHKLDDFIQSILNHSKVINSGIRVTYNDFEKIIKDAFEELKYLPNSERINLVIHWRKEVEFYSDKFRITILLKNFISNAIKYINPAETFNYLKFIFKVTEQEAVIWIEDNGIGIDPQYKDRVFDMFFRATEKSDGSGLGLYIVKQTLERLEGNISLESEPGKGTIFQIILPNFIHRTHYASKEKVG